MDGHATAQRFLEQEATALFIKLRRVEALALRETSVPAASVSVEAQVAIDRFVERARDKLLRQIAAYIRWLRSPRGRSASPADQQRRFTTLRLRFVTVLGQFDLFSDVLTQRSEHDTGVWLAGLDAVASDALRLPDGLIDPPAVACYLAPGHGAAIRRAKTPLPGGGTNPIAIIRIPRERLIGSGIASSLVHEVGHQAAGQLDLVRSLQPVVSALGRGRDRLVWSLWGSWLSEIVADLWSVTKLGIASTIGLMSVVSLPRFFVFRLSPGDPHPPPIVRVLVSCALGNELYPDPQWQAVARLWNSLYPSTDLDPTLAAVYAEIERTIPVFASLLVNHRPPAFRGRSIAEILSLPERRPNSLRADYRNWRRNPDLMQSASPTRVFAVIGQAKSDGAISPQAEDHLLERMLKQWALRSTYQPRRLPVTNEIAGTMNQRLPLLDPVRATRIPGIWR